MKIPGLLLFAALVFGTVVFASTARQEAAPAAVQETRLMAHMERMEQALDTLRRSLREPAENAKSLDLVQEMLEAALASRRETPKMTASLPEGERAAFVLEYRKQMVRLAGALLDLEVALLDGNHEEALKVYKNLKKMEEAGHERFTEGE